MLFPFPKIWHWSGLPISVLQKCQRSSTALKIKDILLKLTFQTHSKFTACPQPALQTHPPLLYYVDNCPEFNQPLSHLFCLPSKCLCSSTSLANPLIALHWLKVPTYTCPVYGPKAIQDLESQMRIIQSGGLDGHRQHDQSTKIVLPGRHPDTYQRQRKGSLWRSKSWRLSSLDLLSLRSSKYSLPARYLLPTSIKKLPQLPCSHSPYLGSLLLSHRKSCHIKMFFSVPSNQRKWNQKQQRNHFPLLTFTKDQQNPKSEGYEEIITLMHSCGSVKWGLTFLKGNLLAESL